MTIDEVLSEVEEVKPNTYDDGLKIRWLSELDGKIFHEVVLTHEHDEDAEFNGYDASDLATELIVPFPYSDIYRNYIYAMIDFSNGESDRYQMSMTMFNNAYSEFIKWYNRTHKPIAFPMRLF